MGFDILRSYGCIALSACFLAIIIGNSHAQFREYPPKYDYHNLPRTKFTCEGRLTGRYYADPDTDCQMFHVCAKNAGSVSDFRFLCPNGTVFDQEHQVCADYYQVVCHSNVGTNPLGHIFEIYKIGAKESTRDQAFGTAPSRDPVYLGQNSLTEEFQAEEYNNNKLASQNTLRFQTSAEKPSGSRKSNKNDIFYYAPSSTTPRPTQQPRSTTTTTTTRRPSTTTEPIVYETRPTRPLQSRVVEQSRNVAQSNQGRNIQQSVEAKNPQQQRPQTTPKPAPVFKNTPQTTTAEKLVFSDFNSLAKFQHDFHHGFTTRRPQPTTTDFPSSTTTDRFITSTFSQPSTYYSEENVNVEPNYYETERSTQGTTYRTTTYVPTTTFTPTTRPPTKTPTPTKTPKGSKTFPTTGKYQSFDSYEEPTSRKSIFGNSNPFSDFKSLASFQHSFHHGFTTKAPKKQSTSQPEGSSSQEAIVDFKPKSETESPLVYQTTTPRKAVFHSTFRANSNDIPTTVSPPTFQQQPSRFNEDFFRKIESKYDTAASVAVSSGENDKYVEPAERVDSNRRRPIQQKTFQNENAEKVTSDEDLNEVISTLRPVRRGGRRRPQQQQQVQAQPTYNNGQYKFSRRVENARFDDKESYAVRERSQQSQRKTEEIFDTEASVFRGSPVVNNFYNEERRPTQSREDVKPAAPQEYTPALFGRRVRPNSRQRVVQTSDAPEPEVRSEEAPRRNERTRVVKRVRRPTTTTTEYTTEYTTSTTPSTTTTSTTPTPEPEIITSTNKAIKKLLQVRTKLFSANRKNSDKFYETRPTTTTEEPELVTASDDEIERIRQFKSSSTTKPTTSRPKPVVNLKPVLLSFKVEDKRPISTSISNSTRVEIQFDKNPTQHANNTKHIVKQSTKVESVELNPTRSPDYDYSYYDSDVETDYLAGLVSRQEKYGKKPPKTGLSKS